MQLSPNFTSMFQSAARSPLNGLLTSGGQALNAPKMPDMPTMSLGRPMPQAAIPQTASAPSRASFLNAPSKAKTEYVSSPPPTSVPQSVWRSPSDATLNYRQNSSPGIAAGLLDDQPQSVSDPLRGMASFPPQEPQPPEVAEDDAAPPPREDEEQRGEQGQMPQLTPQFVDPVVYLSQFPNRRFEVL